MSMVTHPASIPLVLAMISRNKMRGLGCLTAGPLSDGFALASPIFEAKTLKTLV